ncbi:MAG: O-antigen ligase family protein [Chloroflexi bacterium]|nr:O-antigen ligase family protein [Chloroflexota bacterium]
MVAYLRDHLSADSSRERGLKLIAFVIGAVVLGVLGGILASAISPIFLFPALAGLPLIALLLLSTYASLLAAVAIICLLPFAVIPIRMGATPSLLELVLFLFFLVWILGFLSRREEKLIWSPLGALLLVFLIFTVFSFVLGLRQSYSTDTVHNYFRLVLSILLFFGVINSVRTPRQVHQLVIALIVAGTVAAFLGLVLYYVNHDLAERILTSLRVIGYPTERVLRYIEDDPARAMRATSTSVDPNSFGGMLVLIIALAASQISAHRSLLKRALLLGSLGILLAALMLTYGRGAWVGAAVALLFVALIQYRRLWFAFVAGAAAIFAFGLGGDFFSRLMVGLTLQDKATLMRLSEFQNAFQIIRHYPLFGIGFGGAPSIDLYPGVSSVYLTIGERMGLIGLGLFLAMMVVFFRIALPAIFRICDRQQQSLLVGLVAAIVGGLAVGVLDHYFFNIEFAHMAALFWLVAGLAMVAVRWNASETAGQAGGEEGAR